MLYPHDVFTPRLHEINPRTYVSRALHENEICKALTRPQHIVLTGESGSGKTWLYKKVLKDSGVPYTTVNLSVASRIGNIDAAIRARLAEDQVPSSFSQSINKEAGITPLGWGGFKASKSEQTTFFEEDAVALLFRHIFEKNGGRKSLLILENFEQILGDDKLLKQTNDLLMLSDDEFYGKFQVQFLIVGVPTNITKLLGNASNSATISNRLYELSEISRLEPREAKELVSRGFDQLGIACISEGAYEIICWLSDRVAQHIQQLCLCVAEESFDSLSLTSTNLRAGVRRWIQTSLTSDFHDVSRHIGNIKTSQMRLGQVLYCIARTETHSFTKNGIEHTIKDHFSNSVGLSGKIKIGHVLDHLCDHNSPLIRRTADSSYHFVKPTYKLILRSMIMRRLPDQKIEIVELGQNVEIPSVGIKKSPISELQDLSEVMLGYGEP